MKNYGFNFNTLYLLDMAILNDIVHIIQGNGGNGAQIAQDYDVIIRGSIIPFLRKATKADKKANKDEVMRQALIYVAQKVGVKFDNWQTIETEKIAAASRRQIKNLVTQKFDELPLEEQQKILRVAGEELEKKARLMGIPLVKRSGAMLNLYLATNVGLFALASALGITFGWGVFLGAATLLSVVLSPIAWIIGGLTIAGSGAAAILKWFTGQDERKLLLVVVPLLFAIGENPYDFFGLPPTASPTEIKKAFVALMKTFHPEMLEENLPGWVYDEFNETLLRCMEAAFKLKRIYESEQDFSINPEPFEPVLLLGEI